MQESSGRSAPIAAILAIVGGVLLLIGSFLVWAEISGGGTSETAKGITDVSDAWYTLGAGVVVLVIGALSIGWANKRILWILAIVAALIGAGVGLYDALTAKDQVLDGFAEALAGQYGGTVAQVRALLDQALDAGQIAISVGIGLYIAIAGGVLGVVGGSLGMRGAAAAPATPAMAMGTMPAASTAVAPPPMTPPAMPESVPPMAPPPMPEPPAPGGSTEGGS